MYSFDKYYFDKLILIRSLLKSMWYAFSNTAGEDISKHALNNWHSKEFKREDIGLKEMEQIISTAAINSKTSKCLSVPQSVSLMS